jgi:predicted nucleic acid-binding protein
VRYADPIVGTRLDELLAAGVVATCGIVELQLLSVVRDKGTYAVVSALRKTSTTWLEMSEADFKRALEVQAMMVEQREVMAPWPVLVVAAVAERNELTLLHCEREFEVVAGVTGQTAETVKPV